MANELQLQCYVMYVQILLQVQIVTLLSFTSVVHFVVNKLFIFFLPLKVLDALSANMDTYFFTVPSLTDVSGNITLNFSLLKTLVCVHVIDTCSSLLFISMKKKAGHVLYVTSLR